MIFQGGSASGPGLTAFVLISLLENNDLGGVSNMFVLQLLHISAPVSKISLENLEESPFDTD